MADVVVIGAGVIGASIGWHLRRLGVRDVLLVDRAAGPGEGSTGRATGGFRAQFSTEVNVRLSLLSREKLLRFQEDTGVDPGYLQAGYLWLARTEEQLSILRDAQRVQHRCGLHEAVILKRADIARVNPHVRTDDIVGAAFCPTDGYIRPLEILRGYLQDANVRWNAPIAAVRRDAVALADGSEIACGAIVNAAGAWAARIAEVPVTPLRRQVATTPPTDVLPPDTPMTIWADDGFHVRPRDGRVLVLAPGDDAGWLDRMRGLTQKRVPPLRGVTIEFGWDGLYEMSPDNHAILGRLRDDLYVANGSSGHGVMHSPAIGQLLAELIVHGAARSLDIHALRPSRFVEGRPNRAPDLL
ncbi:MAG: FAD-binding oxidoreductase [Myxococcales bacterium]|nr:FAD-binding oxidoreductase [Myxococcales bacterium]